MKLSHVSAAVTLGLAGTLGSACQPGTQVDGPSNVGTEAVTKMQEMPTSFEEEATRSQVAIPDPSTESAQAIEKSASQTTSSRSAAAVFEKDDAASVSIGDIAFKMRLKGCEPLTDSLTECTGGADIEILNSSFKVHQTLHTKEFYLNPRATLYRGPLDDDSYWEEQAPLVVTDINGDGIEDLAIKTGREGGYGSHSYEVYLYDKKKNSYVLSRPFSDLTVGRLGMFKIANGKILASRESGCCEHSEETFIVENNKPKLVETVTETSADGVSAPKRAVSRPTGE